MHVLIRVDNLLQSSSRALTKTRRRSDLIIVHPGDSTKKIKLEIPGMGDNDLPTLVNKYSIHTETGDVVHEGFYTVEETVDIRPKADSEGWRSLKLYPENESAFTGYFSFYYSSGWMIWDGDAYTVIGQHFEPWNGSTSRFREELIEMREYPPDEITVRFPHIESSKLVLFFVYPEIVTKGAGEGHRAINSVECRRATIALH